MNPVRQSMSAVFAEEQESRLETATAMETKTTRSVFAVDLVPQMRIATAFAMMLTHALALSMLVEFAMVRVPSMTVVVRTFQPETVTAAVTSLTPLTSAADHVPPTQMTMASAMTSTRVSGPLTLAVYAMAQDPFMNAAVRKCLRETVTATGIKKTPLASAGETAWRTSTEMVFVMTRTIAQTPMRATMRMLETVLAKASMPAESAVEQEFLLETAIATETKKTP